MVTDETLISHFATLSAEVAALRTQVANLQSQLESARSLGAALAQQLAAQQALLNAQQELMSHTLGTQSMAVGVAAAGRFVLGKGWLETAKKSALIQLPTSGEYAAQNAEAARIVTEIFDKIETAAQIEDSSDTKEEPSTKKLN